MSFDRRWMIVAAGLAMGTGGCTPIDPSFGEALKYDMAVQTVNPDGAVARPGATVPGGSGEVGGKASERYRKGQVKQVEVISSSTSVSGGSGPK